jgi:hypothetical protein
MPYPKFLYRGGKWSPHSADHLLVHSEGAEQHAVDNGFAPHDPELTEKPEPGAADIGVDAQVQQAGALPVSGTDESPAAKRKPGVARGRNAA